MKRFKITYLSGQSLILLGDSLDEVTKSQEQSLAWLKVGRPWVGIASIIEVSK